MAPRSAALAAAAVCVVAASLSSSLPPQPAAPTATTAAKASPARRSLLLMTLPRFVGCPGFGHPNKSRWEPVGLLPSRLASLTGCSISSFRGTSAARSSASCVVALRLLLNGRLGVTGGYTDVIENVRRRSLALRLARLVLRRPGRSAAPPSR